MNVDQEISDIVSKVGKTVKDVIKVTSDGSDFSITNEVALQANELGFEIGPMCGDEPRALAKSDCYIAKWKNIPRSDYPKMDGFVICEDSRNGKEAYIVSF